MTHSGRCCRIFDTGGGPRVGAKPVRRTRGRLRRLAQAVGLALATNVAGAQEAATHSLSVRDKLIVIAIAEDGRGVRSGPHGTQDLLRLAGDSVAVVRRAAVRALGRLQDAAMAPQILTRLSDTALAVRLEAINAYGQAFQGLRGASPAERREAVSSAMAALTTAGSRMREESERGVVGRTLGRLPYADSQQARSAERAIVNLWSASPGPRTRLASLDEGTAHGLYTLARARRTTGPLTATAVEVLQRLSARSSADSQSLRVRRLALLGLIANGSAGREHLREAQLDPDEQLRRIAVTGVGLLPDTADRRRILTGAMADRSWLVRHEAARAWRAVAAMAGCAPLAALLDDPHPHVVLAALDALSPACPDAATSAVLRRPLRYVVRPPSTDPRQRASWHVYARALVALGRLAPDSARRPSRDAAASPWWPVRVSAARTAALTQDTLLLVRLAADTNGNVRAAALSGLRERMPRAADDAFLEALAAPDYHVVLEAAAGLQGTTRRDERTVSTLFASLERLTSERRENARDPRLAILDRIADVAGGREEARLRPFVTDFDSAVAKRAATILREWTGTPVRAAASLLDAPRDSVDEVLGEPLQLAFYMSRSGGGGGGAFVVRLDTDAAPMTAARLVRLARAGYYDGLTFHRVEPGFVIQGGSPGATEYVGDGPFMRDELGLASHRRGTLGISTRGRDTGDAQVFVNLVDNARLDHDYTVVGEIVRGRSVAESIMEADVIERVEVRRAR